MACIRFKSPLNPIKTTQTDVFTNPLENLNHSTKEEIAETKHS